MFFSWFEHFKEYCNTVFGSNLELISNDDWIYLLKYQEDLYQSTTQLCQLFFPIKDDFFGYNKPDYLQLAADNLENIEGWPKLDKSFKFEGKNYIYHQSGFLADFDSNSYLYIYCSLSNQHMKYPQ